MADHHALLVDPVTKKQLVRSEVNDEELLGPELVGCESTAIGMTDTVMRVVGEEAAYPVIDEIPILMKTEQLSREEQSVQVGGTHFAEAYQEQQLYSELASAVLGAEGRGLDELQHVISTASPIEFPEPPDAWFGGGSTAGAYIRSMRHLAPVSDQVVLQIGGVGTHALKFLHAGAAHAFVISPVVGELIQGRAIARELGMQDRITFVGGVAEQLPLSSATVDRIYSGSSMHHTDTTLSFPEIHRVLAVGGKWASVDVWHSRFHDLGTRVFGKCHGNPYCHPLSPTRVAPAAEAFDLVDTTFHGGTIRYPLAVAERIGFRPGPSLGVKLAELEDRIPLGRGTESLSSLVCLTGTKRATT